MYNYYWYLNSEQQPNQFISQPEGLIQRPLVAEDSQANSKNKEAEITEKLNNIQTKYKLLKIKYDKLKKDNGELLRYIEDIQENYNPSGIKKKIKRRVDEELVKEFSCTFENCKKEYASKLALNLHIKLKHKSSRQISLKQEYEESDKLEFSEMMEKIQESKLKKKSTEKTTKIQQDEEQEILDQDF